MNWSNLKGEYQILVTETVALKTELRKLSPSPRLLFYRGLLDMFEARLDTLFMSFSTADSHLANAGFPSHGVADWGTYLAGAVALRNCMDAAEYKHVVLDLIFLEYSNFWPIGTTTRPRRIVEAAA